MGSEEELFVPVSIAGEGKRAFSISHFSILIFHCQKLSAEAQRRRVTIQAFRAVLVLLRGSFAAAAEHVPENNRSVFSFAALRLGASALILAIKNGN